MARPAGPGRTALLDAGRRLLSGDDRSTLASMSVNAVVAEAAMSKGAFFQHFPTRRDYVLELHRSFHDRLAQSIAASVRGMEPGPERLARGLTCYLDTCLEQATTKALLFQARADVDLAGEVAARNARFAALAVPDLVVVGWDDPARIARLVMAATAEVALIEADRGRRDLRQRRALLELTVGGRT